MTEEQNEKHDRLLRLCYSTLSDLEFEDQNPKGTKRARKASNPTAPNLDACRSPVFNHFTWDVNSKKWKCNYCPKSYCHASNGGATTLHRHLTSKHPNVANEIKQPTTVQRNVADVLAGLPEEKKKQFVTKEGFQDLLLQFVVGLNLPFDIVESSELRNLISYCSLGNSKCELPSRSSFMDLLDKKFEDEQQAVKEELLSAPGKVSFAIDGWTSKNMKSFEGVLASWIDEDWELQSCVIDMAVMKGSHTGVNIASAVAGTISEYNLWDKILAFTTDNASSMDTFFNEMDRICREKCIDFRSKDNRVRCLAHIINLACQDVIKCVTGDNPPQDEEDLEASVEEPICNVISKVRKATVTVRASVQRLDVYEKMCSRTNVKHKSLIRDVTTRWNSTLHMLERFVEMKEPFLSSVEVLPELEKFRLSASEWESINLIIPALRPFETMTEIMSQNHSSTIPDSAAVYQHLFEHLEKYTDRSTEAHSSINFGLNVPEWLQTAATAGWKKLQKYYPSSDGLVYVVSTVMDPRCKLQYFEKCGWDSGYIQKAKRSVMQLWETRYKPDANDPESEKQNSEIGDEMDKLFFKMYEKSSSTQKVGDELQRYLDEPIVNPMMLTKNKVKGSLGWWKIHQDEYPNLSRMARDYLPVQGTSVPMERVFSGGPDLLHNRRLRLSADTIRKCICLRNWLKRRMDREGLLISFMEAVRDKVLDFRDD